MGCQTTISVLNKETEITLRGLLAVEKYYDDLLIISRKRTEHFTHLRSVFQRIRNFDIKLAADKCKLLQKHMEFLGYKNNETGIRPEKDTLKIISDTQAPQTVKEIRQTLGFFTFYKMFVPYYSFFSNKLTFLTRKNSKCKGGFLPLENQKTFQQLKMALLPAPTLNNPDISKPLHLFTDANKGTHKVSGMIRWALVQARDKEEEWYPISFGSWVLTKS